MQPDPASDQFDVPARIVWHGDQPIVELRRIGTAAFAQAFWDDVCAGAPITAIAALDGQPEPDSSAPLHGAIFHTYRCGSTLLCRQLSALPGVYAVAEPDFLSQLVLGRKQSPALLRARLLKVLALLARGLGVRGQRIVVKWPGLLADQAAVLVKALPDVPMLFLHRDPVEVLASIDRRPLGNIAAAPAALGLPLAAADSETAQAAAVIAHLCRRIAQTPSIRRCDYARLDALRIATHFGLGPDEDQCSAMLAAARWYSKAAPGQAQFASDGMAKHAMATAQVRRLAAEVLDPAFTVMLAALAEL